jgi:hypothetical protein
MKRRCNICGRNREVQSSGNLIDHATDDKVKHPEVCAGSGMRAVEPELSINPDHSAVMAFSFEGSRHNGNGGSYE